MEDPAVCHQRFVRWALFHKAGSTNSIMLADGTWEITLPEEPSAQKLEELGKIGNFKYVVSGGKNKTTTSQLN